MSIQEHLNKIRNAIYGREVRESIAKGIETAYDDASEKDNANMEVKIARGTHPNLRSRLEEVDNKQQQTTAQLAQKATKGQITSQDLSTATDSSKIKLINLAEEVQEAMAGTAPVISTVENGSITREKIAKNAVSENNLSFVKNIDYVKIENVGVDASNVLVDAPGSLTYKVFLEPFQEFKVIPKNAGNRWFIFVSNTQRETGSIGFGFDKVLYRTLTSDSFDFVNDAEGKELYLYVNNGVSPVPNNEVEIEFELPEVSFTKPLRFDNHQLKIRDVDFIKGANLFNGEYTGGWVASSTGELSYSENTTGVFIPIEKNVKYFVETLESHDRFLVALIDSKIQGEIGEVLTFNPDSQGFEKYQFTNSNGYQFIFIGLSASSQHPKLKVTDYDGLSIGDVEVPLDPLTDMPLEFELKLSAISDTTRNTLSSEKEVYPTLFGVKTTNARDDKQPTPIGWLYYVDEEPYKILYANGTPDNMEELFTWDKSVTWNGEATPKNYMPFITKDGDILFTFRGEQQTSSENGRQNPILYPAGDYDNPIEIDFGNRVKPTSWLQNAGADYIYNEDVFIFTEYTRPIHDKCYVWKVTKPYANPDNWRRVNEFEVSGHPWQGFKHAHTINYDPYSKAVYLTTGDEDEAAYVYESRDYGETWRTVIEASEKKARLLNFIFTKEKIYWASDSGKINYHSLFEVPRGSDNYGMFDEIEELWAFPYKEKIQATYVTALINNPPGLLFLDRFDNPTKERLDIYFWSFETESAHTVKSFYPLNGEELNIGFRCEATNWYQAPSDKRIVCGFGYFPNEMDVFNNVLGDNKDRVGNLALEVVRK